MQHAQQAGGEVGLPAVGVDQARPRRRSGIAIALIVKSRRARSASMPAAGSTTGRAPGLRIALGAGGGDVDLVAVEAHLCGREALVGDDLGAEPRGKRGGVALDDEVDVGATAAEQKVAHGAADQVDGLARGLTHRVELGVDALQRLGEALLSALRRTASVGCLP